MAQLHLHGFVCFHKGMNQKITYNFRVEVGLLKIMKFDETEDLLLDRGKWRSVISALKYLCNQTKNMNIFWKKVSVERE